MAADTGRRPTPSRRIWIVVAVAIAIAIILWLVLSGGDDDNNTANQSQPTPQRPGLPAVRLDQSSLKSYASGQDDPVYWVGPRDNRGYEVTRTNDGSTYIRYLPTGVKAGDPRPEFLTVGSYPNAKALASVRQAGKKKGYTTTELDGGGEAVSNTGGRSVYLAFPNSPVLIEVWDPKPGRSLDLVRGGAVVPVS
jgi:hypothetical protein